MSPANDEHLYLEAAQELDSGTQDPALWVKAMTLALGDEDKARYRYIELRVEEISRAANDFNLKYVPIARFARVASLSEARCIELIRDGTYTGINKDDKWFVSRDTIDKGAHTLTHDQHDNDTVLGKLVPLFPAWATSLWSSWPKQSWCVFIRPGHGWHAVTSNKLLVPPIGAKNWVAAVFPPIWHIATLTRHGLGLLLAWVAFVVLAIAAPSIIYFYGTHYALYPRGGRFVEAPYLWLYIWTSIIASVLIEIAFAYQWLIRGNAFRHKSLEARGYKQIDILKGRTGVRVLVNMWWKGRTRFGVLAQPAPTRTFCMFTHAVYAPKVVPNVNAKNWVAFFFCPLWHLATRTRHGLWLLLARVPLALLGAVATAGTISDLGYDAEAMAVGGYIVFQLVDIAVAFIWLFKANTFRHKSLEARGYKLVDIIEGRTKDEVLAKLKSAS